MERSPTPIFIDEENKLSWETTCTDYAKRLCQIPEFTELTMKHEGAFAYLGIPGCAYETLNDTLKHDPDLDENKDEGDLFINNVESAVSNTDKENIISNVTSRSSITESFLMDDLTNSQSDFDDLKREQLNYEALLDAFGSDWSIDKHT